MRSSECFQPFSLLNQPREASRLIREIVANSVHAIDLPAYLVDTAAPVGWVRGCDQCEPVEFVAKRELL